MRASAASIAPAVSWVALAAAALFASQVYLGFSARSRSVRDTSSEAVRILPASRAAHSSYTQLSIQSRTMLQRSNDWRGVFQPALHPPAYPLTLRLARSGGFPLEYINLGLFLLALAALWAISGILRAGSLSASIVVFYAACSFNYPILAQFTSEALVVPLSLAILLALHSYTRMPREWSLAVLSLLCAAIFLSRFHALPWIFPVVAAHVLLARHVTSRRRWSHLLAFALLSLLPIGLYMAHNMSETGYLTGMDRFSLEARGSAFRHEMGFFDHVRLMLKTSFIDFASPAQFAEHWINSRRYRLSPCEWLLLIAFVAYVIAFAVSLLRSQGRGIVIEKLRDGIAVLGTPAMSLLVLEFYVAYILVTLALWTIGNNDPIYSRFMYPSYVFSILLAFLSHRALLSTHGPVWASWLFRCLCIGIVMVNLARVNHVLRWL